MLPLSLIPGSPRSATPVPPPEGFRGIVGEPRGVRLSRDRWGGQGRTAAQKNGIRYEGRVHEHLAELFPGYVSNPRFLFEDASGPRSCVADGYVPSLEGCPILFEIKYQHTSDAWWQLRKLYAPLFEVSLGLAPICIEVCSIFDPTTPFPEETVLLSDPREFSRLDAIGVYRWRP